MGSYNLIDEFQTKADGAFQVFQSGGRDYISVNPHWVMMVIRYREPVTSSKQRLAERTAFSSGDVSQDDDSFKLTDTRQPLLITSSIVNMDITSSKGNFTQQLSASLKPGSFEFLSGIIPGDWIMCWMMNSKEKYKEVINKLNANESANGFDDGLKFIGRVQDMRKVLVQSPTGVRTVQYNLSGVGFGELDSGVFFDPALARREEYLARFLQDMNIAMKDIFAVGARESNGKGGVDINLVIPALIDSFLGKGLSGPAADNSKIEGRAAGAAIASKEAPFAYVIPSAVANLLGVKTPSKACYSYADILHVIQGLQKYEQEEFPGVFFPRGTGPNGDISTSRHYTNVPLKGLFLPVPTSFDGKSVWNLLNEYLNPAINEMYTAVKYTPDGKVMPTLVVRQLPFSSPLFVDRMSQEVTGYHELPRWVADDVLIRSLDIGRSDGARTNYIHIYAQPSKKTQISAQAYQIVNWPPISDPVDVKRHGLRPHMATIQAAAIEAEKGGPGQWMALKSDMLLGQHMMLTGMVSLVGCTLPIVPGDNFEYDDILYHIESVNHHASISPDGAKTFTTQLTLTHGVRADIPKAVEKFSPERQQRRGAAHLRKDLVEIGEKVAAGKDQEARANFADRYGQKAFETAQTEKSNGKQLDVGQAGENLDIYLYSGLNAEDNRILEPGILVVDEVD